MEWYSKYLQVYEKPFAEAPQAVIEEVRRNLAGLQSNEPLVTVSLIGYNEEKHLLACLWSLSEMKCKYPVESLVWTTNRKIALRRFTRLAVCLISRKRNIVVVLPVFAD